MIAARRILISREVIQSEMGQTLERPIIRCVGIAIVHNPFAGRYEEDLTALFEIGRAAGEHLAPMLSEQLDGPAVAYGKGAIVGIQGEMEHGGACIHPMLGKPMRAAIGGGTAVIPSNVKIGGPGTTLDLPLGHKDDVWSFNHFDTVTVLSADGPRPDEIAIVLGLADGGRPVPRCGSGPQ